MPDLLILTSGTTDLSDLVSRSGMQLLHKDLREAFPAKAEGVSASYISLKISLAFLAPDIVEKIVDGMQPMSLTPERLKKACPLPASWEEQRALLLA